MNSASGIEQYCLLAKGARGRALEDLIQKVTAQPGMFAFGELLNMQNIAEVRWVGLRAFRSSHKVGVQAVQQLAYLGCNLCAVTRLAARSSIRFARAVLLWNTGGLPR